MKTTALVENGADLSGSMFISSLTTFDFDQAHGVERTTGTAAVPGAWNRPSRLGQVAGSLGAGWLAALLFSPYAASAEATLGPSPVEPGQWAGVAAASTTCRLGQPFQVEETEIDVRELPPYPVPRHSLFLKQLKVRIADLPRPHRTIRLDQATIDGITDDES